jgi:large subunit ribosomal protein L5
MSDEMPPRDDSPEASEKSPKAQGRPKSERKPKAEHASPTGEQAAKADKAPKGEQPARVDKPREAKPREAKSRDAKPRDGEGKADKDGEAPLRRTQPVRLRERYRSDVMPKLRDRFRYRNVMEVPKLEKVVVNVRVGDATTDTRFVDKAVEELSAITGQRPAVARAKKSIAAFKLRKGMPIATRVTLRGDRMYEFVDKLFSVALPRIKDFKGISERQFDGRGNLNIGVREQLIFPEIEYDKVEKIRGMDITLVTTAKTDEEARELLRLMGLPLREAAAQS